MTSRMSNEDTVGMHGGFSQPSCLHALSNYVRGILPQQKAVFGGTTMMRNRLQAISVVSGVGAMLLLGPVRSDGQEIDFEYRCVILESPSSTDQTNTLPESITQVDVDDMFYVEFWATDSGTTNTGVVSAYTDMDYAEDLAGCGAITNTTLFNLFTDGICDGAIIDELGGSQLTGGVGVEPEWARVAYVEFTATSAGLAGFVLEPAQSESSAYNRGLIPPSDIEYGSCDVLFIGTVPAVSEWGMLVMALLVLTAGTLVFMRRRCPGCP